MRRNILVTNILLVGMFLAVFNQSCTNLDEEVYSDITPDKFFKTDEEFIAALGAAYTSLYFFGGHNSYMSVQEVMSDEIVIPQRGGDWYDGGQWLRTHRHEQNAAEEGIGNAWNNLYGGINTCNRLIFQFESLVADGSVSQEAADAFIAELKTLRALFYFWLLDTFGNVPIVDRFDVPADFAPTQSSRAEVFAWVEQELLENVPKLSKAVDQTTYGRMHYYVGQAILAKLYLNAEVYTGTARWDDCIAACNEIINSGAYSLENNFFDNFKTENGNSKENIFVIPYDEVFAGGFFLAQMTLHYGSQATYNLQAQPWNGYCSLQEFYNKFEDWDVRKRSFIEGPQFASDGVTPILDPGVEPEDPDGPQVNFTPEINEHFPNCLRQAGVRVGKFEFKLGATPNLSNDFPIFRYADILLTKAEALWRKNPNDAEALALVNQVRQRACIDPNNCPLLTELTAEELLNERAREMFYEAWRRQDLIRFDKFCDEWDFKPVTQDCENRKLWPIPSAQLNANPNLVQNPGY